jgi:hypothetical protein
MNTIADPIATELFPAMLESQRCQFISADGRRCAMLRWEPHPTLCMCHARAEALTASHQSPSRLRDSDDEPAEAFDFTPPSGEFHTATDVNRALGKIFCLLAQNRIPRRKAVALGYLGQLLLQTLPQVREEINDCLGYKAWTETLESAFYEDEPEEQPANPEEKNETKLDMKPRAEDETESGAEAILRSAGLQPGWPSAVADGPTRNTYTQTAAVVDGAAPENQTVIEAHEGAPPETLISEPAETPVVTAAKSNVGPRFSAAALRPGAPISELPETTELTSACSSSSPPETDSMVPAEPEAIDAPTETAPKTLLRGLTYDPWRLTGCYVGPYKSYFDEPEVKQAFLRKYGYPIEEANKRRNRT